MIQYPIAISLALIFAATSFGQTAGEHPEPSRPLTLTQVWKLDATFSDRQHGATFRHPSTWRAELEFGYHPPALASSVQGTPIAGFGYEEGGFPRDRIIGPYSGSNLEGVGVVYSAFAAPSSVQCQASAASLAETPQHQSAVFGHHTFTVYDTGEAGMSQAIYGSLYVTYVGSTCYLFETGVATASAGALDDISALTPAQLQFINAHILKIMKSVRIVPSASK